MVQPVGKLKPVGSLRPVGSRPASGGGNMIVPGVTAGGVRAVNIPARRQEITAEEGAKNAAEKAFDVAGVTSFLSEQSNMGKAWGELNFDDFLKASGNDPKLAKTMLELRDSFLGKNPQKAAANALEAFLTRAKKIPSLPGVLSRGQDVLNYGKAKLGYLPEYGALESSSMAIAPLIRRAMGDVGNAALGEQKPLADLLMDLAQGTYKERKEKELLLKDILQSAAGAKTWTELITQQPGKAGKPTKNNQGGAELQSIDEQLRAIDAELEGIGQ
jgi:hypothetical protein